MKIGMPTLLEYNLEENINFAKNNNFDFIELNMNLPYCFEIKEKELLKYNYDFTMHISEELNIYELNNNLKKSYLKEIIRQLKIGISNNIKKYTIHLNQGIYFTIDSNKKYLNEVFKNNYTKSLKSSLKYLNRFCENNNIYINFENTKYNDNIKIAINEIVKYPHFGFTLDIGHNEKDKNKFYNYLEKENYLKNIKHIHMHDYDNISDHLALGKGIINFNKYKNLLIDNYIVMEVKKSEELLESKKNFSF